MTSPGSAPAAVRRLTTPAAQDLAGLASIFDDLQTVLRCCERLVAEIDSGGESADDLALEVFWTTAVLSYTRCFTSAAKRTRLTSEDVKATNLPGDVLGWHHMLQQLREHYVDCAVNPRETLSVGVSQDPDGHPNGIAVTAAPRPRVDDITVRKTGAIAYELSRIVDRRIAELQDVVYGAAQSMTAEQLDQLTVLDLTGE
jgi:hypothetical protein